MVTEPPASPPPLGVGPHALPQSPSCQLTVSGLAAQVPASVGVWACAGALASAKPSALAARVTRCGKGQGRWKTRMCNNERGAYVDTPILAMLACANAGIASFSAGSAIIRLPDTMETTRMLKAFERWGAKTSQTAILLSILGLPALAQAQAREERAPEGNGDGLDT